MKNYKVKMVIDTLNIKTDFQLPKGYTIRLFTKDDIDLWAEIEAKALEFESKSAARKRFMHEFKDHVEEMEKRCLILEDNNQKAIGTVTAWYGNLRDKYEGRIHWLSIIPEYQGKNLAKPLMMSALKILKRHHSSAYLTTQTKSIKAINLYLDLGFKPYLDEETHLAAWPFIKDRLNRKDLHF